MKLFSSKNHCTAFAAAFTVLCLYQSAAFVSYANTPSSAFSYEPATNYSLAASVTPRYFRRQRPELHRAAPTEQQSESSSSSSSSEVSQNQMGRRVMRAIRKIRPPMPNPPAAWPTSSSSSSEAVEE